MIKKANLLLTVTILFSALLYGLGFYWANSWPLLFFHPISLSFLWIEKNKIHKKIIITWFSGLLAMLSATFWILGVNSGALKIYDSTTAHLLSSTVWLFNGLLLSVGFLIFSILYKYFERYVDRHEFKYMLFGCLFILSEYVRSVIISLGNIGPGASIGDYWVIGSFGLGLASSPAVYASRLIGLYGLGFLGMSLLSSLIFISKKKYRKIGLSILIASFVVIILGWLWPVSRDSDKTSVAVVSISDESLSSTGIKPIEMSYASSKNNPDIIIFPEYSGSLSENKISNQAKKIIETARANGETYIIDALVYYNDRYRYNKIIYYDKNETIIDSRYKSFLIPYGEYIPYYANGLLNTVNLEKYIKDFNNISLITKQKESSYIFKTDRLEIGSFPCSAVIAPRLYQTATRDGANLLTSSSDLSIFNKSQFYSNQNLLFLKFHAVANHRTFIQSAKFGNSYIINENGNVKHKIHSSDDKHKVIVADVDTFKGRTPFSIWGEWTLLLVFVYLSFMLIRIKL